MKQHLSLIVLFAALTVLPVRSEDVPQDSLQLLVQQGDSCMRQYNTFAALQYYQQAYDRAKVCGQQQAEESLQIPSETLDRLSQLPPDKANEIIEQIKQSAVMSTTVPAGITLKLADCLYRRASYRQVADLLKNVPEDSLSHEAFRQLALSYKKQSDLDSYIYWAGRVISHYPMDGEMVAGRTLGFAQLKQPQNGIECGEKYFAIDSTNVEVNRALADAYFIDHQFDKSAAMYDRLLQQGDSVFNTLYSAGMAFAQIDSLERAYSYLGLALALSGMQHMGCAYRLGVVCVDTKRYEEGLGFLDLAIQLMKPDGIAMRAITLSQGEAYYLTQRYPEAVAAWKEHLIYNPASIATYYNIANALAYLLKDAEQAESYYRQFLELAREEEHPTNQLKEMMERAEDALDGYRILRERKAKQTTQ